MPACMQARHTIALVQGDALGGGFEAALSCHTIVAEAGVLMGLPEVLFDLFPGMGAYSFMCQRVSPHWPNRSCSTAACTPATSCYQMGLVDVLAAEGRGLQAVEDVIRANRRIPHARAAMHQVREPAADRTNCMRITESGWIPRLKLGDKSIRTMERLVRAAIASRWSAIGRA